MPTDHINKTEHQRILFWIQTKWQDKVTCFYFVVFVHKLSVFSMGFGNIFSQIESPFAWNTQNGTADIEPPVLKAGFGGHRAKIL